MVQTILWTWLGLDNKSVKDIVLPYEEQEHENHLEKCYQQRNRCARRRGQENEVILAVPILHGCGNVHN